MADKPKGGNKSSNAEGLAILAVLVVVMLTAYISGGKLPGNSAKNSTSTPSNTSSSNTSNTSSNTAAVKENSAYAKSIMLNRGNSSFSYQPFEEYISLTNTGRESIDITGWQLRNAKDERSYNQNGSLARFPADIAYIPKATPFISPVGASVLGNVILKPGETAIITTGSMGIQNPYKIVSFKENICSGYLSRLDGYKFNPNLKRDCPRPSEEPGVSNLDSQCRKFIERMSSCHTPEFATKDSQGEPCSNCVDGTPLGSACISYLKNHYNYGSCIYNHVGDADFSGETWRIFLGQGWEMWAPEYETIKVYDTQGRLVEEQSY